MKKILGIVVLSLMVFSCDSQQVKNLKNSCLRVGLDKKSEAYKECIKSYDHLFVYALDSNIDREQKEFNKHNKYAEKVNSINLNVNEDNYEQVNFPKFLKKNFLDTLLLSKLKNQYSLKKKIKFRSDLTISFDENDKIDLTLSADDPKDYYNSLFFLSNAKFQNIEIQKKIMQKSSDMFWFPLSYPPTKKESLIYGYFDETPGEFLKKYNFYIEDIKVTKVNLTNDEIKQYLIFNYANQNVSEVRSASQIIADITILLSRIIK
jgi:hypothetical protein